jgi:malate dehydrogenase (oxaloacetate-decarboxylating)
VFKGALMSRASCINEEMKVAAINALAALISDDELSNENIIPSVFDKRVVPQVSQAVSDAAYASKVARK